MHLMTIKRRLPFPQMGWACDREHANSCIAAAIAAVSYAHAMPCSPRAGLGEYISGSILFEETLYDNAATGEPFVELMKKQGIIPGIKTDKVHFSCLSLCLLSLHNCSVIATPFAL